MAESATTGTRRKTISLSPDEYKNFVRNAVNRIIEDGCYSVSFGQGSKETDIKIEFQKPVWYNKLDQHAQKCIFDNFKNYIYECVRTMDMSQISPASPELPTHEHNDDPM